MKYCQIICLLKIFIIFLQYKVDCCKKIENLKLILFVHLSGPSGRGCSSCWHLLDHEPEVGLKTGHWQQSWSQMMEDNPDYIYIHSSSKSLQTRRRAMVLKTMKSLELSSNFLQFSVLKNFFITFTVGAAQQWTLDFTHFVTFDCWYRQTDRV